ncbi:MAG: hypothetical protein CMN30_28050 [Sandaracinus sp.]|nr:hypothetical protein [Sandaracinus sp.]
MKLVLGEEFRAEEARYDLRWNCEDCTRFDPEGVRCAHGYPIATHQRAGKRTEDLTFCKEFEAR